MVRSDQSSAAEVAALQMQAGAAASKFIGLARACDDAKEAADWSLAAREAASVSLTCERILNARRSR